LKPDGLGEFQEKEKHHAAFAIYLAINT